MWAMGVRYALPVFVLTMAVTGMLAAKLSAGRLSALAVIVALLVVTKLGRITPWTLLQDEPTPLRTRAIAMLHMPVNWPAALFRVAPLAFARDLLRDNRGTIAHVSAYLNAHATPGDVVITNFEWEPLYFHTRLPQGYKILPQYPIRDAAERHGLPRYVFSVRGSRWLVWRWPWEGYQDYRFADVIRALAERGATVERVATFTETAWENRPNLHFHRWPGGEYLFHNPQVTSLRDAEIYRIEWKD
jgi:hypothetical protein